MLKKTLCVLLAISITVTLCCCTPSMTNTPNPTESSTKISHQTPSTTVYTQTTEEENKTDTDGDGLYDHEEKIYKTDINNVDSDGDALSDYEELKILDTDPLVVDTDKNGIRDYDDDNDKDGLSNGYELQISSNPVATDTDFDGLLDGEELNVYQTDIFVSDTDNDGATDGWEVDNGFNPLVANDEFKLSISSEKDGLTVGVHVSVNGKTAESITVNPARNNSLISDAIPGLLSPAYEFNSVGELGAVEIYFDINDEVLSNENIDPVIFCLNEDKQVFYEMETAIENGVAKTVTSHFSTYILLDKNVYESYLDSTYDIDYTKDSGVDSNNDGISDYITKLMCDGIIRTGTGTMIFGEYSYEEVQANDDIDGDGIINGEEVNWDIHLDIPTDAVEYNGHYYKAFDVGEYWLSARAYCESIGGYLCTITSQEEQDFVVDLLSNNVKNVYWLGGTRVETEWNWVTQEPFTYTNWGHDEPNNQEGAENYLQIYAEDFRQKVVGDWNDASNVGAEYASDFYSVNNTGYICEWGSFTINSRKYAFINSSPIYKDTDNDGFADVVDPTPTNPEYFSDLNHYIQHKHNGKPSVAIIVQQPVHGDNFAISPNGVSVGHTFLLLYDGNDTYEYRGFYPAGWEASKYDGYIDYAFFNIVSRGFTNTPGTVFNDEGHDWNIAFSQEITKEQLAKIKDYIRDNKDHDYNLQSYNCTTFAIKALEAGGFKITDYTSKTLWKLPIDYVALVGVLCYPFGYNPGQTGYDLMNNAPEVIGKKQIQLKDGTQVVCVYDY